MLPHGSSKVDAPLNILMATGTVRLSPEIINVSANMNSFHAPINASSPVVTSAGARIGANTRRIMVQVLAPSTIAASSSSTGIDFINVVSTQTVNGSENVV
ncbi:hypothetical protein D3C75_874950 [compost metagenome]